MKLNALLAVLMMALTPLPAAAQALVGNPFAEASTYRNQRDALDDARYRVRYEATHVTGSGAPEVTELTLDVADDWALAREGERTTLYDFQLNRVFTLSADSFTGINGFSGLTFRIMERQNRSYLQRIVQAAGAQAQQLPDACDAETELSLVMPNAPDSGVAEVRERQGVFTFVCADREMGGFSAGDGAAPPAALWPAVYAEMPTHPVLHRRVRESGRAPAQMSISYRNGAGQSAERTWRLIAVETISTPYPLLPSMRNATAEALDQVVPGAGQIGVEAIAGRALGGAPTLQSWDTYLGDISRRDGDAAASMLIAGTMSMFPELQCNGAHARLTACRLLFGLRALRDPAPWALIEVSVAEQRGDSAGAIAAMQRAQTSPLRDHPALGAAFALAILRFDQTAMEQARAANLPLDVAALQNRALLALPYNPGYWTDVGDRYGRNYDWANALTFYEIAFALPLPSTSSGSPVLVSKRTQLERIRRDFPEPFLPARP
ncbi:MAG: hypothetical protein R3C27_01095 [Hyphomonadaceae bacterium]